MPDRKQTRPTTSRAVRTAAQRFVVVLNEPQDVVNIAGAIRAMVNMGLRRLRLVRPADYDEYRIQGIAHNAQEVLPGVQQFDSLADALADTTHVVGTTARRRRERFVWQHPREAAPELWATAAAGGDVALVFGREDVGLSNEDLDLCDRVITVPTDRKFSSLNLAQAVLLVAYELWLVGPGGARPLPRPRGGAADASWEQHQMLFEEAERTLHALDFFKKKEPQAIMRTLRAVTRRAGLDAREANLLRAMAIEAQKVLGARGRRRSPAEDSPADGTD